MFDRAAILAQGLQVTEDPDECFGPTSVALSRGSGLTLPSKDGSFLARLISMQFRGKNSGFSTGIRPTGGYKSVCYLAPPTLSSASQLASLAA